MCTFCCVKPSVAAAVPPNIGHVAIADCVWLIVNHYARILRLKLLRNYWEARILLEFTFHCKGDKGRGRWWCTGKYGRLPTLGGNWHSTITHHNYFFFGKCLSIFAGQTHTLECKLDMSWKVQLTVFCSFVFTYVCITHCVIKTHMSCGDDIDIIHVLLAEFLHTHYLTSRWRPVVLRPLQVLIQFSFMNVQFWLERALIHKRFENCKKTT